MARINTIYDYLREYGPEMSDRILQSFPPLHAPDDPESPLLQELKRELLPAQKLVVMGLAKSLRIKPSAMLLGEMGTGKTICSLAASYVHAQGRPHSGIVMAAPHLVKKWAREIFMTIPNARVYLIHDMRNIKDPAERRKPHGVFEVILKNGEIVRSGWSGSLSDLRRMGRSGWRAKHPGRPTWFVLGRERGKLSYFWRNVKSIARSGPARGWMVNPDSGRPILNNDDVPLSLDDSQSKRMYEIVTRGKIAPLGCDDDSPALDAGHSIYAPLWTADRSKIQRVAPLEFVGRYMKRFFDFGIADEVHELNGDTAQGNGLSVLARAARRVMGLTGTILGGYAENCFGTLTRLDGQTQKPIQMPVELGLTQRAVQIPTMTATTTATTRSPEDQQDERDPRKYVAGATLITVSILGPTGSPFAGIQLTVTYYVPAQSITFEKKLFHPNVDLNTGQMLFSSDGRQLTASEMNDLALSLLGNPSLALRNIANMKAAIFYTQFPDVYFIYAKASAN